MSPSLRLAAVLPVLFALASCDHNTDEIARMNEEPLGHTNASNIAAMVANPMDLVRGHGGNGPDAAITTAPIDRLESDRPKALPNAGGGSGGGSSGGGGGGGGSGG
jgi:type IV pilus biogenesis protein CpaD/CtpE